MPSKSDGGGIVNMADRVTGIDFDGDGDVGLGGGGGGLGSAVSMKRPEWMKSISTELGASLDSAFASPSSSKEVKKAATTLH